MDQQQSNSLRVYGWNANTPKEDVHEFFNYVRELGQNRQPYINEHECYIDVHYNSADIARKAGENLDRQQFFRSFTIKWSYKATQSSMSKEKQEKTLIELIKSRSNEEKYEIIKQLRLMICEHPNDAQNLLLLHPELVHAANYIIDYLRKEQHQAQQYQ